MNAKMRDLHVLVSDLENADDAALGTIFRSCSKAAHVS